ncbi:MAG: barnase inhibitor [Clostridium sp.]|jgi:ribonuclease inhibitor|nr:barnase inhibitor [Clostridium sp.]
MNVVFLEGKELTSKAKTHKVLKEKLELPDYYGENLNALWDCLTGWVSLPLKVVWNDFNISKKQLGNFADELLQLFFEANDEIDGFEIEVRK